jgi:hypothetical protein
MIPIGITGLVGGESEMNTRIAVLMIGAVMMVGRFQPAYGLTETDATSAEAASIPVAVSAVASEVGEASGDSSGKTSGFETFEAAMMRGQVLWNDPGLGTNGKTCLSSGCHANHENLNLDKRESFPHTVGMVGRVVTLTQVLNFCLTNPMAGKALDAESDDMTALSAYFRTYRMEYYKTLKSQ